MHLFEHSFHSRITGPENMARHSWHQSGKIPGAQPNECMSLADHPHPSGPLQEAEISIQLTAVHKCAPTLLTPSSAPNLLIEIQLSTQTAVASLVILKGSDQNRLSTRLRKPLPINLTFKEFSPWDRILLHKRSYLHIIYMHVHAVYSIHEKMINMLNKYNICKHLHAKVEGE